MPGRKDIGGCLGTSFGAKNWMSLDVCGLLGVSFSWFVHFYALIVIGVLLISNSLLATAIYFAFYLPTSLLAMASLYRAWTTDPGAVPMGARPLTLVRRASTHSLTGNNDEKSGEPKRRRAVRRCHKCDDNYKPPRAHHDSVTGRCIVKFDHFWYDCLRGIMESYRLLYCCYSPISCCCHLFLFLFRLL